MARLTYVRDKACVLVVNYIQTVPYGTRTHASQRRREPGERTKPSSLMRAYQCPRGLWPMMRPGAVIVTLRAPCGAVAGT
eukprot:290420-Prymnesium_polylepis.1